MTPADRSPIGVQLGRATGSQASILLPPYVASPLHVDGSRVGEMIATAACRDFRLEGAAGYDVT